MINDNTTPEFNKLTVESFAARLKQPNLVAKIDFDNKLTSSNKQNKWNKTFRSSKETRQSHNKRL